MFPPNMRDAVDGFPLAVQIAIYSAVLIFALAVMAATVKLSRKSEPHHSRDALIQGPFSIMSMEPVREGVKLMQSLLEKQDQFIDNQTRMIDIHQRNERLLERLLDMLKEGEMERRIIERRRDR